MFFSDHIPSKRTIILSLLIGIFIVGFVIYQDHKPIDKNIFAEPSGYSIAHIREKDNQGLLYGYISNDDIEKINNNEIKIFKLHYPYKDEKQGTFSYVNVDLIDMMSLGIYKDYR